jgi:hypothetical protein
LGPVEVTACAAIAFGLRAEASAAERSQELLAACLTGGRMIESPGSLSGPNGKTK